MYGWWNSYELIGIGIYKKIIIEYRKVKYVFVGVSILILRLNSG